jgi:glutamate formiminotransferase/formiminotetrahydrofolate cyclodeaminase
MVTALTRGKPGLESESPELEERLRDVAERALDLSKRFRCLQDDDGKAFLAYLAALRMPRSTPEEEERRDRVKAETLRQATEVPLETIEAALGVLAVAQSLAALARSRRLKAASDVGAAVELARGAFGAAELNVLTNLASIQSEEERRGCEERLRDLRERFEADYEALRREVLGWLEAKSKGKGGA